MRTLHIACFDTLEGCDQPLCFFTLYIKLIYTLIESYFFRCIESIVLLIIQWGITRFLCGSVICNCFLVVSLIVGLIRIGLSVGIFRAILWLDKKWIIKNYYYTVNYLKSGLCWNNKYLYIIYDIQSLIWQYKGVTLLDL